MQLKDLIIQNIFWRGMFFLSLFGLNILIARHFKAAGSGWVFYLINNLSIILLITGISLESGAAYFTSKNEISQPKIAGFCFVWAFIATAASVLLLWVFQAISPNYFSLGPRYLMVCACYVLGVLLINYFSALFFAKQNFFLPNLILLCGNILIVLVLIFSGDSIVHGSRFIIIYFSSFLAQGLMLAFAYFIDSHSFKDIGFLSFYEIKKILSYSLVALSANIVFFLVYRVDYWFVKVFCTEDALGNYIQVSKLGQIFMLVPSMIAAIIFPKTASGLYGGVSDSLQVLSRFLFNTYIIVIVVLIVSGKWLFPFLYGKSFNEMYYAFLLLSPGILSLSTLALLSAYFAGKNRLAVNLAGSVFSLLVIFAGDILLIPKFGIRAAAAVSSGGYICYLIYSMHIFRKEQKNSLINFFILKKSDMSYVTKLFQKPGL